MESNTQATPAAANAAETLLTTSQVAAWLGIPTATLRYWRHQNVGPASFSLGRRVVYRAEAVQRWLAAQEAQTQRGGVA